MSDSTQPSALHLSSIRKRFGTTLALDDASFTLRPHTIHALLGANGAGKTTLMRVAFGLITPEAGVISINDRPHTLASPADAIAAGVGMVHQHFTLVPAMTVAENAALGGHGRLAIDQVRHLVRETGDRFGLTIDPDARVDTLSVSAQQRAEIVKALVRNARTLILDEPTAVLTVTEAHALLHQLRTFVAQGGSVVLITHKLHDALTFADDVTVLRDGRTVFTASAHAADRHTLARAMLGDATPSLTDAAIVGDERALPLMLSHPIQAAHAATEWDRQRYAGTEVLALRDVSYRDERGILKLHDIRVTIRAGEILGIAAVEGNGQHELLRVLARRVTPTQGTVTAPDDVGFVPEDRHRDGLILPFSLTENIALRNAGIRRGRMPWRRIHDDTAIRLTQYGIRAASPDAPARALSGGNQQKLVLSRELGDDRIPGQAIVVENPTRGLDVHATADIHRRLRDARTRGTAIVIYSSDLDEVFALADRILVMYNGELHDVGNDRTAIGNAMLGATNDVAKQRAMLTNVDIRVDSTSPDEPKRLL